MRKTRTDLSWLPSPEEWDFRSITAEECRIACHWEYSREIAQTTPAAQHRPKPVGDPYMVPRPPLEDWCPNNYHGAAKEMFPRAWGRLTREERDKVMGTFHRLPVVTVRKLGDFLQRMNWRQGIPEGEVTQSYLEHTFVIQPQFSAHGVQAVIAGLRDWARKEARRYRRKPRAKGADLPFDELKWLAVLRLERARRTANDLIKERLATKGAKARRVDLINVERAAEAILAYRQRYRSPNPNDVFPVYSSAGAWTKARKDAERCSKQFLSDPSLLLGEWC